MASSLTEWLFYSLETGDTFIRPYDDACLMPMGKSTVDRIKYLGVRDPILGDDDLEVIGTDTNYIPRFLQPVHVPRGRKRRVAHLSLHQSERELDESDVNEQLAEDFLDSYFADADEIAEQ